MINEKLNKEKLASEGETSVDIFTHINVLWSGRKKIAKITLIFLVLGLIVAVFTKNEYSSHTTIIPHTGSSSKTGSLAGLAAIAGYNIGGGDSESGISPILYPQILNSIPFQKEMIETKLTIKGLDKKISFKEYYEDYYSPSLIYYIKRYTIGLPGLILKKIRGKSKNVTSIDANSLLSVSDEEKDLFKILGDQLSIDVNEKDGYIQISALMPEAVASAELAKKAEELLQKYILNFKYEKSNEKLNFIRERYAEKEKEFKVSQIKLANFQDQNQLINTARARSILLMLQSEYNLAFEVYADLAKQLETQQINVKEDLPVFTVIEPVSIPYEKAKPKRLYILMFYSFLGFLAGCIFVFSKSFVLKFKESWVNMDSLKE